MGQRVANRFLVPYSLGLPHLYISNKEICYIGRPSKINISEDTEKEIVDFYLLPSSAREVERKFGVNLYQLNKILSKNNICMHDANTVQKVKSAQLEKTLIERYGVSSTFKAEEIKQKIKQTNLNRYGVEYAMLNKDVQAKAKNASILKYGRDNVGQFGSIEHKKWATDRKYLEKIKRTCLDRYGVESVLQNTDIKNKAVTTNLKKYGVRNPLQNHEINKKRQATCIAKYGNINNYTKIKATLKANNTFNTSSQESDFYKLLCTKYSADNILKQYSCEKYPFMCDFYIQSEDLFIELNLSWTHGPHPFDKNNPEDLALLEKWTEKAKTSKYYQNAINTWTVRDVKKLQTAKENNLNYKVIYIDEWKKLKKETTANAHD